MLLEGLQITRLGAPANDTPYWILSIAGLAIIVAGTMMLLRNAASKWNDLLAFIFTALLGSIGTWIALFSAEEHIDGNVSFLSDYLGLPLGRIMFGFGALLCFAVSLYALKLFIRKTKRSNTNVT